jgi:hypothetical protein
VTPEELYSLWAPKDSAWSQWVLPVPFAQLTCPDSVSNDTPPSFNLDWLPLGNQGDLGIVVDLPGGDSIYYGLALLNRGYRPVPVIDGSPGPDQHVTLLTGSSVSSGEQYKSACVVDMREMLLALCRGAESLRMTRLAPDAPPAFLLDSKRMGIVPYVIESVFDNRWMAFPQDFPSGHFLKNRGIRRIVLVHDTFVKDPQEDLAHVLLRWQQEGIAIESKSAHFGDTPIPIQVSRPFRFRATWYRVLATLGLRRNDAGGFGGYPPDPSGAG